MKLYKYLAIIAVLSLAAFFLHDLILGSGSFADTSRYFHYSLKSLYLGYSLASILIIFILMRIRSKSIDYVGYTFVLLTGLKMLVSFGIFYMAVHAAENPLTSLERKNILVVFIFFLAIETVIAVRILNSRQ